MQACNSILPETENLWRTDRVPRVVGLQRKSKPSVAWNPKLTSTRAELRLERQKRNQGESELVHAERNLETVLGTRKCVTASKLRRGGRVGRGKATAVLCCNDWHAEGCVTRESVGGANEFNLKITDRRIRKTWRKALYLPDFARHISNIRELVIWLGGDLISGTIHEELEESNFLGPAEAVLYVQDHLASGIDLLRREAKVDAITVVTSYGNHGRTTRKRRISTGTRGNGSHSTTWPATTVEQRRSISRSSEAITTGSMSKGTMFASTTAMQFVTTAASEA